jgi:magnesium-transporting ATPase (P-type)
MLLSKRQEILMTTLTAPTKNKVKPAPGPQPAPKDDLKTLPMAEVEKKLSSTPDGLTDVEAKKRLTQYGPNEIKEEKTNFCRISGGQYPG